MEHGKDLQTLFLSVVEIPARRDNIIHVENFFTHL